jgi:2-keto-4-pentenoate hydratase/2-oxohepta-3-ene-1,7-dioic acid hydratase in catechol pathway
MLMKTNYFHRWLNGSEIDLPVGKVVCVGRNFADHAKELKNEIPETPLLFIKPETALVSMAPAFSFPTHQGSCHYECELAFLVRKEMKQVLASDVWSHLAGVGLALDLTLREVQDQLKKKGHPWEVAKAFDGSCPMSPFISAQYVKEREMLGFTLEVDQTLRQVGFVREMIFSVERLIAYMSQNFTLRAGDIILTGTPKGVAALSDHAHLSFALFEGDRNLFTIETVSLGV